MPYQNRNLQLAYEKGYYAGFRKATIEHLGGKCQTCGTKKRLQIHHVYNLCRKRRSVSDLKDLSKLQVYCKKHHEDVDTG